MPTNTAKPKPPIGDDGLTQSERFMQAARELECDDDPERFREQVRKLTKTPPLKSKVKI